MLFGNLLCNKEDEGRLKKVNSFSENFVKTFLKNAKTKNGAFERWNEKENSFRYSNLQEKIEDIVDKVK